MITRNLIKCLSDWTGGGVYSNISNQACILATGTSSRYSLVSSDYNGYMIYPVTNTNLVELSGSNSNASYIPNVNKNLKYMMANLSPAKSFYSDSYAEVCWTILLGTGTIPATKDDIAIETPLNFDDIYYTSWTRLSPYTGCGLSNTIQNRSANDLTINEIGLACCVKQSTGSQAGRWYNDLTNSAYALNYVLMTREVLNTPIIMPAGSTRTFTISINYEQMLNNQ